MGIREKRLKAVYELSRGSKQQELLSFLLGTISHNKIKEVCEYFNLKPK